MGKVSSVISGALLVSLLFPMSALASDENKILYVNGEFAENILVKEDVAFFPLRVVGEGLGYEVIWTDEVVELNSAGQHGFIDLTSGTFLTDKGVPLDSEAVAVMEQGKLYVPQPYIENGLKVAVSEKNDAYWINLVPVLAPGETNVISVGDEFTVTLNESRHGGTESPVSYVYEYQMIGDNLEIVKELGQIYQEQEQGEHHGTMTWTFVAKAPGKIEFVFETGGRDNDGKYKDTVKYSVQIVEAG